MSREAAQGAQNNPDISAPTELLVWEACVGRDGTSAGCGAKPRVKSNRFCIFLVLCSVLTTSSAPATLTPVRKEQRVGNGDVFKMECEPLRCLQPLESPTRVTVHQGQG